MFKFTRFCVFLLSLDSEGIAPAMEPLRIASDNTDTDDDDEEEESGLDEAAGYS